MILLRNLSITFTIRQNTHTHTVLEYIKFIEIDYFLMIFFGVFARSSSVFLLPGCFNISLIITFDDRVSAFNNFDICSKQASFSWRKQKNL